MFNTDHVLTEIAQEANCSPEQVRLIVGRALAALHKVAVCDEMSVTATIMQSLWMFGEEACYHLGGILEESRQHSGPDGDSWTETYLRFAPELWPKYRPVLESWMKDRTERRKLLDSMADQE